MKQVLARALGGAISVWRVWNLARGYDLNLPLDNVTMRGGGVATGM